jgi:hypothetical protein
MKQLVIFVFVFFISQIGISQKYWPIPTLNVSFGEHEFEAYPSFYIGSVKTFSLDEGNIYGQVGRNKKRGYFLISGFDISGHYFNGDLLIYTTNGSKINCRFRNLFTSQNEDGKEVTAGLYFLTISELEILYSEGIEKIYFVLSYDKYGLTSRTKSVF